MGTKGLGRLPLPLEPSLGLLCTSPGHQLLSLCCSTIKPEKLAFCWLIWLQLGSLPCTWKNFSSHRPILQAFNCSCPHYWSFYKPPSYSFPLFSSLQFFLARILFCTFIHLWCPSLCLSFPRQGSRITHNAKANILCITEKPQDIFLFVIYSCLVIIPMLLFEHCWGWKSFKGVTTVWRSLSEWLQLTLWMLCNTILLCIYHLWMSSNILPPQHLQILYHLGLLCIFFPPLKRRNLSDNHKYTPASSDQSPVGTWEKINTLPKISESNTTISMTSFRRNFWLTLRAKFQLLLFQASMAGKQRHIHKEWQRPGSCCMFPQQQVPSALCPQDFSWWRILDWLVQIHWYSQWRGKSLNIKPQLIKLP